MISIFQIASAGDLPAEYILVLDDTVVKLTLQCVSGTVGFHISNGEPRPIPSIHEITKLDKNPLLNLQQCE